MVNSAIQSITLLTLSLLLLQPGTCQECACVHEPDEPHNKQSLYYNIMFYDKHNRYPTWADAMDHCSPGVRSAWSKELEKFGIMVSANGKVEGGSL